MASIVISGDTSGAVTVTAPAVAGTNTVTLPAATGTTELIGVGTAQNSTSGTSIDFTGIPSWAKRIAVMFSGVSTSGTAPIKVQLGTGATPTYVTSGYASSAGAIGNTNTTAITGFTDSFPLSRAAIAADTISSLMTIVNITGTTWVASANTRTSGNTFFNVVAGQVDAGAAVTALRVTINGTDTFDAGSINIMWEG